MEVAREQVDKINCFEIEPEPKPNQVAGLIGADPKEIIWTSGATESNNIAVKGVGRFYKGKKKHVVTTQTEHKCVKVNILLLLKVGVNIPNEGEKTNYVIQCVKHSEF